MTSGNCEIRITVRPEDVIARNQESGGEPVTPSMVPKEPLLVATLTAPDFFGEMGLMTGEARLADVVATTDVDCLRLGKETFEKVLLGRPEIVDELSEKLATRRVELLAVRDGLDAKAMRARHDSERERIVQSIKTFFGL
jgi:CRP-like cAMP-binding protein